MPRDQEFRDLDSRELLGLLLGADDNTRWAAAEALGERRDIEALQCLTEALSGDRYRHTRIAAAKALGQIGTAGAIPALKRAVCDGDSDVCWEAIKALEKLGEQDIDRYLVECLANPEPWVRGSILLALETRRHPELVRLAIEALGDVEAFVGLTAAGVLGRAGAASGVEPLISAFSRRYKYSGRWPEPWDLVSGFAAALAALKDVRGIPVLIEELGSRQEYQREALTHSLVELGKLDRGFLVTSFENSSKYDDGYVKWCFVSVLKGVGGEAAIGALSRLASDDSAEGFRNRAAEAAKEALMHLEPPKTDSQKK
jgi:HEAT repeat protein